MTGPWYNLQHNLDLKTSHLLALRPSPEVQLDIHLCWCSHFQTPSPKKIIITFPRGMMEAVGFDFTGKASVQQNDQISIQDTQTCGVYRRNETRKFYHFQVIFPNRVTHYRSCTSFWSMDCKRLSWKHRSQWQSLRPSLDRVFQRQLSHHLQDLAFDANSYLHKTSKST